MTDYRRLYDRMAPWYGWFWERTPAWRRYSELLLPELEGSERVLEIGPGPGLLLAQLAERQPLALGVDLSMGMLQRARARLSRQGSPVGLVQGQATGLPYAAGSFDAVLMSFVFSAIPEGLAAMREFHRVLAPGGRLLLIDAGRPSDGNPLGRMLAWCWERFGDFMRDEAALMQAAGFEILECRELGVGRGIRLVAGRRRA
jgi:ubiquinone/menaquinone biosynthesis C-methylase UbiE